MGGSLGFTSQGAARCSDSMHARRKRPSAMSRRRAACTPACCAPACSVNACACEVWQVCAIDDSISDESMSTAARADMACGSMGMIRKARFRHPSAPPNPSISHTCCRVSGSAAGDLGGPWMASAWSRRPRWDSDERWQASNSSAPRYLHVLVSSCPLPCAAQVNLKNILSRLLTSDLSHYLALVCLRSLL